MRSIITRNADTYGTGPSGNFGGTMRPEFDYAACDAELVGGAISLFILPPIELLKGQTNNARP